VDHIHQPHAAGNLSLVRLLLSRFFALGNRESSGVAMLMVGATISLYIRAHQQQGGAAGIDMVLSFAGAMRRMPTWGMGAALIVSGVVFWSPATQSLPTKIAVVLGNASYSAYLASQLLIEFTAASL
jgi:peptidoglycan/LPS O-acetylase OafA/YrhL